MLALDGGTDGVGDNDDSSLDSWRAVWHRIGTGDAGGDVHGEAGFAAVVVAIDECNACERDAFRPEPADGLGLRVRQVGWVDGGGIG